MYNYKNNNEQHVEVIKSIENKISDFLSDKKAILKLAIFSVIESMRNTQKSTLPWSIITMIIKIHCHHQQEVKTPTAIYWTLGDK